MTINILIIWGLKLMDNSPLEVLRIKMWIYKNKQTKKQNIQYKSKAEERGEEL